MTRPSKVAPRVGGARPATPQGAPDHSRGAAAAEGLAMVARVVSACSASRAAWVIVVTGHQADLVTRAVRQAPIRSGTRFLYARDHASGLSASLRAGLAGLPPNADAVLVCLGDMPGVSPATMDRLIAAHVPGGPVQAVVPVWQGRRGNPVLWDRRCFADLATVSGDAGGRQLLRRPGLLITEVPSDDPYVLADCDTPAQAAMAGYGLDHADT